jgi:hypothetical protein
MKRVILVWTNAEVSIFSRDAGKKKDVSDEQNVNADGLI